MAKPEIIKDMYLQQREKLDKPFSDLTILPGSYGLYDRKESELFDGEAFYGTFYQGAGSTNSQFIIGSKNAGADSSMYFRRALEWDLGDTSTTFSEWQEVAHSGNVSRLLNGLFVKISGDEMTGNLRVSSSSTAADMFVSAKNGNGEVSILASANRGLYDFTKQSWIIARSQDGTKTYVPQWASVGSNVKFVYFDAEGKPVATSKTVGSGTTPVYMSGGQITAMSTTVGAADVPVYLNKGSLTRLTHRMAATNASATTAVAYSSLPQTGIWYVNSTDTILGQSDGSLISYVYNSSWETQIYQDFRTGQIALRGKNNGTWQTWRKVIDSINYASFLDDSYVNTSGDIIKGSIDLSAAPVPANSTTAVPHTMGRTITGKNGGLHFQKTPSTDDHGNAITWSNTTDEIAQAGIYVKSSDHYGTKMYLATTNLYADGAKAAVEIDHLGNITALRGMFKGTVSRVENNLLINGKTYNGSAEVNVGVIATTYGGTGVSSHTANRLVWSNSSGTAIQGGYHYANASTIGVNYTGANAPNYNFYVNGTSYLNGAVTLKSDVYEDSYDSYALNLNNSNIVKANGIYFADSVDTGSEGIHFYRGTTTVDSFYSLAGKLKYAPGRTLGAGLGTTYYVPYTNTTNGTVGTTTKPVYSDAGVLKQVSYDIGSTHETLATTTKFYLLGTTRTTTGYQETTYFDTGIYATTEAGQLSLDSLWARGAIYANGPIYFRRNSVSYGSWTMGQSGLACTTEGTAGRRGTSILAIGNDIAQSAVVGEGANNARGSIRLYGSGSNYTSIVPQANGDQIFWLPNYAGEMYAAHTAGNSAVGSQTKFVFVEGNGRIVAASTTIGANNNPVYVNSGAITKSTATIGSGTKPIYMNSGVITASSSTVGGTAKPIYMSSGTLTASTSTIGSSTQPIYMSSGTLTASTSTAGTAAVPVYLNSGVITACTASSVFSALSWTNGTTAGPVLNVTVAGQKRTATIPYATGSRSGVVTTGAQTFAGNKTFANLILQGTTSSDSTISAMNRFEADLYVAGNGSAPNQPNVAGFYMGKSASDENRHLDIVSGGQYSYIDFNKASIVEDYKFRILVDVESGLVDFMWNAATAPKLNIQGSLAVTGGTSLNGALTFTSSTEANRKITTTGTTSLFISPTSTLWLDSGASSSIVFRQGGTEAGRFGTDGHFRVVSVARPNTNNGATLGTSSYYWSSAYVGKGFFKNTVRIGTSASMTLDGNWCEGIRINAPDGQWVTIALGTTGDTGTNANCWSIHRTNTGNFAISKNSSDGANGLVMTSTGMGLGTTAPSYRLHVVGDIYANGGWVRVSGNQGLYFESHGGGWYMTGSDYIRAYNNKPVYVSNSTQHAIYTAGGFASSQENGPILSTYYNGTWYSSLKTYGNGNLTIDGPGGSVFLAYTSGYTYFGGGTYYIDRSGNFNGKAATATSSGYLTKKAAYTTIAETDAFLENNKVQWATVSAPATSLNNDGIVMSYGWSATYGAQMFLDDGSGAANCYIRNRTGSAWNAWRRLWASGDAVTSAVWNDYAECREADTIEPGYVLIETGDDTLTKSTERLSPFAGVSSDTWGFSQGETDKAKTPIAVAGRVLVYPWQDRDNYKPGDCVCAAPDGKVDIMTREEVIQYPDRIVGTVSSVPTYDKWGGGEMADREPVNVNGRIWIKVR